MASNAEYCKADSTNLPKVKSWMMLSYMSQSDKHNLAEIRGAKALMSSRDSYLETCIGYVEIKRVQHICTVRSRVIPEHRIRGKAYRVTIQIDEREDEIIDAECDGCAAAQGGCKHTLVFIFWLEKKSSEPAGTSVTCYWKKPRLQDARVEHVNAADIFKNAKKIKLMPKDPNILAEIRQKSRDITTNSLMNSFNSEKQSLSKFNVFDLTLTFIEQTSNKSFEEFKKYCDKVTTQEIKNEIAIKTMDQADAKLWHNLRQGRITASQLYEAAHCKVDGTLVQQILGGYKVPETVAIKRGKKLEKSVIKEIEKKQKVKVKKLGLVLINGLLGASPDGICDDYVIEVKCPSSEKTIKNYVSNNKIKPKFMAQICLQMLATNKTKGLFCVANPQFEINKKIVTYWVDYDQVFTDDLISKAMEFWKINIYPKLLTSAQC